MVSKKTVTVRYIRGLDKYIGIQFRGKFLEDLGFKNGDKVHIIVTDNKDILLSKNTEYSSNKNSKNHLSKNEIRELLAFIPETSLSGIMLKVVVLLLMETKLSLNDIVEINMKQFSEMYDLIYIEDKNTNLYRAVELSNNLSRTIRNFRDQKFANGCTTDYLLFNTDTTNIVDSKDLERLIKNLSTKLDFNITVETLKNTDYK